MTINPEEIEIRLLLGWKSPITLTPDEHAIVSCVCERCKEDRRVVRLIRRAVVAERERCAVIAEIAATHTLSDPCRIIAKRIRIDPAIGE